MKQAKSNKKRDARRFPEFVEPILRDGYPKADEDDDEYDDDDEPDLSSVQKPAKNPFNIISFNLYNSDYNNRIIVINEQIDQKCFVYAKMIESWNRQDRKALELKERIKKLIDNDSDVALIFRRLTFEKLDEEFIKAKKAELSKKVDEITERHPEIHSILAELVEIRISNIEILDYEPIPIKIKFNSPGGWVLAYQTLADVISLSKTKVIGINMGMAYSAAAFLLIACHERLALPKSRVMIHRGSGGNFGTFEQTESSQQNYKEVVDEVIKSIQKRTKIPSKVLKKNMNPDWYLSAQMALKYSMIDRIVTDINEIL